MIRKWLAQRKLARDVAKRRESFEIQLFTKNRAAQLKRRGDSNVRTRSATPVH